MIDAKAVRKFLDATYGVASLAEHLDVSKQTVSKWMYAGMPYFKLTDSPTAEVRFDLKEVEKWLEGRGGIKKTRPKKRDLISKT